MKSTNNIPALRRLWKACFEADSGFLDLFFGEGFALCRTFVSEVDSRIVSSLSVFPVEFRGQKGGYVYGVCTDPAYRGHRYAVSLLKETEEYCRKEGMGFLILRPASQSLFGYYRKLGYTFDIYRHQQILNLPAIPEEVTIRHISGDSLHHLRNYFWGNSRSGVFQFSTEMCRYIVDYIKYCHGQAVSIMSHDSILPADSYFTGYPDPENPEMIICEEAGILPDLSNLPLLLSSVRHLYPNALKLLLPLPPQKAKEEFMLCKIFKSSLDHRTLFSYTME